MTWEEVTRKIWKIPTDIADNDDAYVKIDNIKYKITGVYNRTDGVYLTAEKKESK